MSPPLASSDIWLLLAIAAGGREGEAGYRDIIGAGDMINHAIFTHEELESGLYKLREHQLIIQTENGFVTTDTANTEIEKAIKQARGWLAAWDLLKVTFNIEQNSKSTEQYTFPGYSVEEVELAIAAYHADMHELNIKLLQKEQGLSREAAERQIEKSMAWHRKLWESFKLR